MADNILNWQNFDKVYHELSRPGAVSTFEKETPNSQHPYR